MQVAQKWGLREGTCVFGVRNKWVACTLRIKGHYRKIVPNYLIVCKYKNIIKQIVNILLSFFIFNAMIIKKSTVIR